MLRLSCHVSGNSSGRLHRGTASPPRSIDCSLLGANLVPLPRHVTSWLASRQQQWLIYICTYTYIYIYIYIYIYTYIYIYIRSFMCATECGKRIYFMLSGWFSSSSGLFHTRLFCCMFVSHTCGCLGACVCVYIYWSNLLLYVYILHVYTHEVVMCVDRCCTRSSYVSGYICIYIHAGSTGIYLRICAQSSHVWVYVYVYTPKVYMCMCIYYVHTRRIHMCV